MYTPHTHNSLGTFSLVEQRQWIKRRIFNVCTWCVRRCVPQSGASFPGVWRVGGPLPRKGRLWPQSFKENSNRSVSFPCEYRTELSPRLWLCPSQWTNRFTLTKSLTAFPPSFINRGFSLKKKHVKMKNRSTLILNKKQTKNNRTWACGGVSAAQVRCSAPPRTFYDEATHLGSWSRSSWHLVSHTIKIQNVSSFTSPNSFLLTIFKKITLHGIMEFCKKYIFKQVFFTQKESFLCNNSSKFINKIYF